MNSSTCIEKATLQSNNKSCTCASMSAFRQCTHLQARLNRLILIKDTLFTHYCNQRRKPQSHKYFPDTHTKTISEININDARQLKNSNNELEKITVTFCSWTTSTTKSKKISQVNRVWHGYDSKLVIDFFFLFLLERSFSLYLPHRNSSTSEIKRRKSRSSKNLRPALETK